MKQTRIAKLAAIAVTIILCSNCVTTFGASDGFSSGNIIVLTASTFGVTGNVYISANKTTSITGESVKFSVSYNGITPSFVGRVQRGTRTATYTFQSVAATYVVIDGTSYSGASKTKSFSSTGTHSIQGKIQLKYSTTKTKADAGFPRYFYKTVYSSTMALTVKSASINHAPEITDTYTSIAGNKTTAALYNNTDSVRFCADMRDTDGDSANPSSTALKRDGITMYDGVSHTSFKSTSGVSRTRGPYSNMKRGTWSLTWKVTDGKLSDTASYSKVVHNRAPIITSANASPSSSDQEGTIVFKATAMDPDGDNIDSLRLYVNNSAGTRVYPASANFKYVSQGYSSGVQKSISLGVGTMGLSPGKYTACFYAVDGYDGSSKSGTSTIPFTVTGLEAPVIVDTYTTIDDIQTDTALYNNTTGIKFCAKIRGKADRIETSSMTVDGITKYEGASHNIIDSNRVEERYRGTYSNPQRGTWSVTWKAYLGSKYDSKKYSREVRNRAPIISSAYINPNTPRTNDPISIMITALDPDKDNIKKIEAEISGNGIEQGYTNGKVVASGVQQRIDVINGSLSPGQYTATLYAYDDYDNTVSEPVKLNFRVLAGEEETHIPVIIPTTPESPVEPPEEVKTNDDWQLINAEVYHTDLWNKHRNTFNKYYFENDYDEESKFDEYIKVDSVQRRGRNVFWSGEKFLLQANTTDNDQVNNIEVSIVGTEYHTELTRQGEKWTGSLFRTDMIERWGKPKPEELTFQFKATSGNTNKIRTVKVIVDDRRKYWDLHRTA